MDKKLILSYFLLAAKDLELSDSLTVRIYNQMSSCLDIYSENEARDKGTELLMQLKSNWYGVFADFIEEVQEQVEKEHTRKLYQRVFETESDNKDTIIEILRKNYLITDEEFAVIKKKRSIADEK